MAVRQPAGVILSIAPWNAPVILGVRSLATPLACGNTVVFKSSEICPRTHRLIADALNEAGLPPGVLNVVSNAPEDAPELVAALIAHPAVRRVNFTGSTRVGKVIAETAARNLKPALLELGGKAPMVVLDDADIDAAVDAAAFGAYMNQGQICMSTERIVIDDKIADKFVAALSAKASTLRSISSRTLRYFFSLPVKGSSTCHSTMDTVREREGGNGKPLMLMMISKDRKSKSPNPLEE